MSERAQLSRMADAADNALAAMALAYEEMFFGGDWESAKARLKEAGANLEKALSTAERTLGRDSPRLSFGALIETRSRD